MPKKKLRPLMTYIYDTREKRVYDLKLPDSRLFDDGGFYEMKLGEGDISVEIDCKRIDIYVERKQLGDFVNCCGRNRETFEAELARLSAHRFAHVIIEAPFALIRRSYPNSWVPWLSVYNSIACWATQFPTVHFWPVTNRSEGQIWAWQLIHEACKHGRSI